MKKRLNSDILKYGVFFILIFSIARFILSVHAQELSPSDSPSIDTPEILNPTEKLTPELPLSLPEDSASPTSVPQPTEQPTPTPTVPEESSFLDNAFHFINQILGNEEKSLSEYSVNSEKKILLTTQSGKPNLWLEENNGRSLIAGPEMITESSIIDSSHGTVFWLDEDRKVLYGYNTTSQGVFSASYNPKNGENFLFFTNESGEKMKATFEDKGFTFRHAE